MRWWYWIICQLKLISTLSDDPNNPGYIDNNQLQSLSDKFSSSVSEFLAEILTRTVFPTRGDGRVTPSVTCYGVTRAWRGPEPGAQKPGPGLSQCSQLRLVWTRTLGPGEWAHTEMRWPLGRETGETARTIRRQDSRDPCLGGAGAQSDTKIETRS